ncbi:MAG TPA: hypothetical protein VMJ70_15380 [Candidatus Sulfotelmatobacter sp.]|nr:hypothetical protein [Candidatus Sulfotelmatobacter sp.]
MAPHLRLLPLALATLLSSPALAQPTMDSLWPSDNGNSWSYSQHFESTEQPPSDSRTRLFFDGTTVAPDAIAAQYLRQEMLSGMVLASALESMVPDPFLRQVWIARPDLRAKIAQAMADAPCPENAPVGAHTVLLNGEFAFRKTPDEIAAWRCNLANTRSWQWLVSDLTLGHEFTLQLIPDLADDVFLHGTIAAIEPVTVPAGTFSGCVRVDYLIDYGLSQCTDASGNVAGTSRSETRGSVDYAPDVGPVRCTEAFIPNAEVTGSCDLGTPVGEPAATASMLLDTAPTPARRSSWGQLKATYR